MASPAPTSTLRLLEDDKLLDLPDTQLLDRIRAADPHIAHLRDVAISAGRQCVDVAIAIGQVLEVLFKRHEGEFKEWLALALPKRDDGSDFISYDTALRYRTLWKNRARLLPVDGSSPSHRPLTDAYMKVEILPDPDPIERDPTVSVPCFRLVWTPPTTPPDEIPAIQRRALMTKAEPVALFYLALLPREEAVALLQKYANA